MGVLYYGDFKPWVQDVRQTMKMNRSLRCSYVGDRQCRDFIRCVHILFKAYVRSREAYAMQILDGISTISSMAIVREVEQAAITDSHPMATPSSGCRTCARR